MTEDEIKSFLDENKSAILSTVKQKAIDRLVEQHRWDITEQISKVVNAFVIEEVVPEVKAHLMDIKGPIVEAAVRGISGLTDELAKGLAKAATENVANSYRRENILKALFA